MNPNTLGFKNIGDALDIPLLSHSLRIEILRGFSMIVKVIVVILLLFIVYSLGSALNFMVKEKHGSSMQVIKLLTWRIGLSLFVFFLLLFSYWMGWIEPHQI